MPKRLQQALKEVDTLTYFCYDNFSQFDERLYELCNLETLIISSELLQVLPAGITKLQKLQTLHIRQAPRLCEISEDIAQLSQLRTLIIENTALKALPETEYLWVELQHLHLANNALLRLPKSWSSLKKLKNIALQYNPFEEFPTQLLHAHNADWSLSKGLPHFKDANRLNTLLRMFRKYQPTAKMHASMFWLFLGDSRFGQKIPLSYLISACGYKDKTIQQTAQHIAECRIAEQYPRRPLRVGSSLAIWGKTLNPKAEIIEQIEGLGIQVVECSADEKPTHILLGTGIRREQWELIEQLLTEGVQFIMQPQLSDFLQSQAQFYLAPTDSEAAQHASQSLAQLLRSGNDDNTLIALEMMRTGGVPKNLLIDIFAIACRFHLPNSGDRSARPLAQKLLQQHASKALYLESQVPAYPTQQDKINPYFWPTILAKGYFSWREVYDFETHYAKRRQDPHFWLLYIDEQKEAYDYLKAFFAASPDYYLDISKPAPQIQRWLQCPYIIRAKISNIEGEQIPDFLIEMRQLQMLSFAPPSDCSPLQFERLSELRALRYLCIPHTNQEQLPERFFQMPHLQHIDLYNAYNFRPETVPAHFSCTLPSSAQRYYQIIRQDTAL